MSLIRQPRIRHPVGGAGQVFPEPMPTFALKGIEDMEVAGAGGATTSQALAGNVTYFSRHYHRWADMTFTTISPVVSTGSANNAVCGIYSSGPTGNPLDLLWISGTFSTTPAAEKPQTFASGTWQAAGAAYKDGSNRLVLAYGQTIWKGLLGSANVTWRTMTSASMRVLGRDPDAGNVAYTSFSEVATYPTLNATATPVSRTAQVPFLALTIL